VVPFGRSVVIAYQVVGDVIEILRIFYGGQDHETIMGSEGDEDGPLDHGSPELGIIRQRNPT
jgi:hypothetical protein